MTDISDVPAALRESFPWPRPSFDPPDLYATLRHEQPIVQVRLFDGRTAWLVTRYDDVRAVLSDPRVSADDRHPGFPDAFPGVVRDPAQRSFFRMDPPEHTKFRRMLSKNFILRRGDVLRPQIETLVDSQVDHLLAQPKPADFVREFALPIPSTVISWLLGVPVRDAPFFNDVMEAATSASPSDPTSMARAGEAMGQLFPYLSDLVGEYEAADAPGDHVIGQLIGEMRDGICSRQDVLNSIFLLLIAGHDTTASMTSLGTLTLLQHPDQMAELRGDPALIPAAVEELLRYLTIVHLVIARVATEDIEVGGVTIPAGDGILPLNFSADRDDDHFPNASTFDIHRDARDHFAFGFGVHQCMGQSLARVELAITFETLLRRIPTLELAAPLENLPFKSTAAINGLFSMPVTW